MVKKSMKKLFVGLAVISAASISAEADLTISNNYFQARAFSANLAREMLMEGSKHRDSQGWYGEFSATAVYQRSWSQSVENDSDVDLADGINGLGVYPFWSGTNSMTVGSAANGGAAFNLDAYQFGLGLVTANGSIALDPIAWQAGADFMFVVGSSADEPCFFAKIKAPVAVFNMNPQLTQVDAIVPANYVAGALDLSGNAVNLPAATMVQAFAGNLAGGQTTEGNFTPMQYGLVDGDQSTGAKFGDIEMTAGYRFISNDDNSFSVAVRAAAPTGGQATGVYMLQPIVGRGGNWLLGGYVDGHVRLWEGNNENSFVMKLMANAQHLFNADTVRSFDLTANGPGSKYLLVANYSGSQYQGQIQNLINYTTLAVNSSFGVEGDAVIDFAYVAHGWTWDLGYEFWGRSSETLEITGAFANQVYAVLGNQGVGEVGGTTTANVNACQPLAAMNIASAAPVATPPTNQGPAVNQSDVVLATYSINCVALTDLNVEGAQQATSLTSKVFSKVSYEWIDSDYRPHLGIMGEFEISNSNNNALPQWSVSLVGGVSF